jgi:probable F420-dependent oxidoreductase
MMARALRFGVSMLSTGTRAEWHGKARQAEDLGYDILHVTDHFGMAAPFPALLSAAEATSLRVGPLVLNAGLYQAVPLARDVVETDRLTEGRLQLGLGTGYLPTEFAAVNKPFPAGAQRVDLLARLVTDLRAAAATPHDLPPSLAVLNTYQRMLPPLLIAGAGDRLLRLAAREADIVQFQLMRPGVSGTSPEQLLAERIDVVRHAAAERFQRLELSVFTFAVAVTNGTPDLGSARAMAGPGLSDEDVVRIPGVLVGSVGHIAETVLRRAEELGVTYLTVLEPDMRAFGDVIAKLR